MSFHPHLPFCSQRQVYRNVQDDAKNFRSMSVCEQNSFQNGSSSIEDASLDPHNIRKIESAVFFLYLIENITIIINCDVETPILDIDCYLLSFDTSEQHNR